MVVYPELVEGLRNPRVNLTDALSSIIKAFSDFRLVAQIREELENIKLANLTI